ncbi:hypothetical protein Tco_0889663 [Tanacetum coccineum]
MSFLSTDITSYKYWLWVVSSGSSFVSTILGQMTYSVASPTLDSAASYVMQGAPFTQGTIPSIPIGGSISPEGFLPSILLLVVIIVIVFVVIIVVIDDVPLILKLSLRLRGSNISFNTSGQSTDENFHKFLDVCLRTVLLYQESFKFRPGDLIGFFYLGIRWVIPESPNVGRMHSTRTWPHRLRSSSRPGVPVRITSICHCCSLCFQSYGNAISNQLLDGSQTLRVYGMVHNDEDGDNDANDGDDDERRDKLVL